MKLLLSYHSSLIFINTQSSFFHLNNHLSHYQGNNLKEYPWLFIYHNYFFPKHFLLYWACMQKVNCKDPSVFKYFLHFVIFVYPKHYLWIIILLVSILSLHLRHFFFFLCFFVICEMILHLLVLFFYSKFSPRILVFHSTFMKVKLIITLVSKLILKII